MNDSITVFPVPLDDWFPNPGIGFTAAPGVAGHPAGKVYFFSVRWRDIEPERGAYRWDLVEEKLAYAKSIGCTAIVRCSPYALRAEDDVPDWFRAECPESPSYLFWRVDPNDSPYADYWSEFIRAFASRFDGHPVIASVDLTIVGAWGEGGGTELMRPESIRRIVDAYFDGFQLTPLQALLHDPMSMKIVRDRKAKVGFRVDCLGEWAASTGSVGRT